MFGDPCEENYFGGIRAIWPHRVAVGRGDDVEPLRRLTNFLAGAGAAPSVRKWQS